MDTGTTNRIFSPRHGRRSGRLAICFALVLSACGSVVADSANEPTTTRETITEAEIPNLETIDIQVSSTPAPEPTVDRSRSFSRPVQPFDGDPFVALTEGQVEVRDTNTGALLATQPFETGGRLLHATTGGGAVYMTERFGDTGQRITRVDAGGIESILWEDLEGRIEHLVNTPLPAIVSRDTATTELVRFHADGQIETFTFGENVSFNAIGETILLVDNTYSGDIWVMDQDLTVIEGYNVGSVATSPTLVNEHKVQLHVRQILHFDIRTLEVTLDPRFTSERFDLLSRDFANGWRAEFVNDTVTISNPAGEPISEISTGELNSIYTAVHPSQTSALVILLSCEGLDGADACPPPYDGEEDPAEYPGLISLVHVNMNDAAVTELEIGNSIGTAALAVDDGWFVVSVDGVETMQLLRVGHQAELTVLEELTPVSAYHTGAHALGPELLALDSQLALLTDDGVELMPGTAITAGPAALKSTPTFTVIR